jgi:hypothetical protein
LPSSSRYRNISISIVKVLTSATDDFLDSDEEDAATRRQSRTNSALGDELGSEQDVSDEVSYCGFCVNNIILTEVCTAYFSLG